MVNIGNKNQSDESEILPHGGSGLRQQDEGGNNSAPVDGHHKQQCHPEGAKATVRIQVYLVLYLYYKSAVPAGLLLTWIPTLRSE